MPGRTPCYRGVVEDCLSLAVWDIPWLSSKASSAQSVRLRWLADGIDLVAELIVTPSSSGSEEPMLQLSFSWTAEGKRHLSLVSLSSSRPNFGGVRFWFACPIDCLHGQCLRRCSKLYLPVDGSSFGCRHCYELTYASRREAHKYGRLSLGLDGTKSPVRAREGHNG